VIFVHLKNYFSPEINEILIISVTFITSVAMVSKIKFDNLPRPTKKSLKKRPIASISFIIGLVLVGVSKGLLLFPLMILYILVSSLRQLIIWLKETKEASDDFDEGEDFDQRDYDL
jgi:CDP-diacylglycerol--serine O-phosphatidyltransferase